jgi:CRP/FNR family transcriptional regulator
MRPTIDCISPRPPTDCAVCPDAERCWEEAPPPASGFLVHRSVEIADGEQVFGQGERFAGMHIVVSGCVKLLEVSTDGAERIVDLCLPGDLLGISGWLHERYPHTAIAARRVKLCQLVWPRSRTGAPPAALLEQLLRKTAKQLEDARHAWLGLPAVDRVAAFLARFAERTGSSFALPITRSEIGSLLGLAEETVVRAMRVLRERNVLRVEGNRVTCVSGPTAPCTAQ